MRIVFNAAERFGRHGSDTRNRKLHREVRARIDDKHEIETSQRRNEKKTVRRHRVDRQIEGIYFV